MSLFQHSVLNKYLKEANQTEMQSAFQKLKSYFHNPVIQQNIRESKEEQFQEGFLTELFVKVLGYTINPNPDYNLTTEFKNERGAKKADGAILKEGAAIGVIELKSTKTKDLESIRLQAFDYKANQSKCVYVISSNFEKIRFYINNAVDFEEFDLFTLKYEQFQLLWLCLAKENLLKGLPLEMKEASLLKEENVTKQIYIDYSAFKRDLYHDLIENNLDLEIFSGKEEKEIKLLLFKKSQKLLDRFLFIFFGEDRGLLPPNSISEILKQWEQLKDLDEYKPLYDRYKKYFSYLNKGWKGKQHEIFAYNGGLFAPDEILDNVKIDDEILQKHTKVLTAYDFETDVDVNILGHIFENSLNEIEEVAAQIGGAELDLKKSKRKKDGVFYTPKYITKYIVENTVGKLCDEKKIELGIDESEYLKSRKGRTTKKLKELSAKLDKYRNWLLALTICDPACGSGAFLNQALDFLIREHHYIDELKAKLLDVPMIFTEVENSILEKNIYGVDINEESVEIAKLSLWLRTAQKGRKLTTLSNNIKCGNSLIDEIEIAGEKAFNWQNEFPEVFKKGGFDVVIGNPPYVRQELVKDYFSSLQEFTVFSGKADLYTYFYEKGCSVLKSEGILSFISSGKFFEASYGKALVKYLIDNFEFNQIINFDDLEVFEGISAYPLIFIGIKRSVVENYRFKYCFIPELEFNSISEIVSNLPFVNIQISDFVDNDYNFYSPEIAKVFKKVNINSIYLKDINCLPLVGIKTGFNDGFVAENDNCKVVKPYLFGKNLKKYVIPKSEIKIVFPYSRDNNEYSLIDESELIEVRNSLENSRKKLESRAIIKDGIKNGSKKWYEYQQINKKVDFEAEYIVYPNVSLGTNFTLSKGNIIDMTGFIIPSNDKFLLSLLNSKLCNFLMRKIAITRRGGYQEYKVQYLEKIPLKSLKEEDKKPFKEKVELIFDLNKEHILIQSEFSNLVDAKFNIEKFSKKLQNWHDLEFKSFLVELKKAKINLTLSEEAEWMQYFNEQKQKAQTLKSEIDKTDREIDLMVYELYGLTEEEIGIVEGN